MGIESYPTLYLSNSHALSVNTALVNFKVTKTMGSVISRFKTVCQVSHKTAVHGLLCFTKGSSTWEDKHHQRNLQNCKHKLRGCSCGLWSSNFFIQCLLSQATSCKGSFSILVSFWRKYFFDRFANKHSLPLTYAPVRYWLPPMALQTV